MLPLLALSHDDAVATQLAVYFELMLLRLRAARCCLFTLRDLARSCSLNAFYVALLCLWDTSFLAALSPLL